MSLKGKDFLTLKDFTGQEILDMVNLGIDLKTKLKAGIPTPILAGKSLGMIFQKASTRTRVSFEVGMYQLGGQALFLSSNDLQIGRGEPIQDTARVLSRYLDCIMIRTFDQKEVEDLAKYGSVPIINGLTDFSHPCQVLADLMTIREKYSVLEGLKMCYIGDGDNMANSLIVGGLKVGMQVSVATPKGYEPDESVLAFAKTHDTFFLTNDPQEAIRDADVVITDTWASMGMESEKEIRQKAFAGYQVNQAVMDVANAGAMVLHCLPAHRGEEITAEVFEAHAGEIFDEAENRMHSIKAVLVATIGR